MKANDRIRSGVLGIPIDVLDWTSALRRIMTWAANRESRYVCICNAHSVVTATREADFAKVIDDSDMATPDGAPVAWVMRKTGHPQQQRINGPDLMLRLCAAAVDQGTTLFLFGSTEETLKRLRTTLPALFPGLQIAGSLSPPFRSLTVEEDEANVRIINESGAGIILVSLGCPKQERWMREHRGRVHGVMLGVGAAFDFHAGTISRAPQWMQANGLEWLHRLASEPRRLWRRYLSTNSAFVAGALKQLIAGTKQPR